MEQLEITNIRELEDLLINECMYKVCGSCYLIPYFYIVCHRHARLDVNCRKLMNDIESIDINIKFPIPCQLPGRAFDVFVVFQKILLLSASVRLVVYVRLRRLDNLNGKSNEKYAASLQGIIRGKLAQQQRCLEVHYAVGRDIRPGQLDNMITALHNWCAEHQL